MSAGHVSCFHALFLLSLSLLCVDSAALVDRREDTVSGAALVDRREDTVSAAPVDGREDTVSAAALVDRREDTVSAAPVDRREDTVSAAPVDGREDTVSAALQDRREDTRTVSGTDCVLRCSAAHKPGVRYRAVRWYKVTESPSPGVVGLATRDLPDGVARYGAEADREAELLDETHSLFLPNVTCGDGGVYLCHLASPVGEQITEGRVHLTLTDCSSDKNTDHSSVILATVVLIVALLTFLISYRSLRNLIRDRNQITTHKDSVMDSALKPLDQKDLMLIYTLGPKPSAKKHVIV